MVAVLLCCTQLAFCRCLVLLTLSELFSSKGRWLILSTVTALAVGGPLINIAKNGEKLGQTGICIQELVKQDAKELLIQYKGFLTEKFKPLTEAIEKMEKIIKGLFRFWWFMSQGLIMVKLSILRLLQWMTS